MVIPSPRDVWAELICRRQGFCSELFWSGSRPWDYYIGIIYHAYLFPSNYKNIAPTLLDGVCRNFNISCTTSFPPIRVLHSPLIGQFSQKRSKKSRPKEIKNASGNLNPNLTLIWALVNGIGHLTLPRNKVTPPRSKQNREQHLSILKGWTLISRVLPMSFCRVHLATFHDLSCSSTIHIFTHWILIILCIEWHLQTTFGDLAPF